MGRDDARAGVVDVAIVGIWLTAAIVDDRTAIARTVERCEQIALAPRKGTSR
jgi:hypothetical protein